MGSLRSPAGPGTARSRSRGPDADPSNGQGQPDVGLRPSPRRVAQARSCGLGECNSHLAAPAPNRAGTLESKAYLEVLPANASFGDRAHGLPQCRHRASEAALHPLIYGAGDEAGDLVRGERPPRRCLGDPASQKCQQVADRGAKGQFTYWHNTRWLKGVMDADRTIYDRGPDARPLDAPSAWYLEQRLIRERQYQHVIRIWDKPSTAQDASEVSP